MTTAARPLPGSARPYRFPQFERRSLENGVRVIVAPVSKLPLVSVMAVVEAGAVCDPPGREGLADLAARALVEGAGTLDGAELTERLEMLGGWVDPAADWDYVSAIVTVMSERAPAAMRILGDVLTRPAFPDREIERLRAERRAEILQQRTEPRGLADEMFSRFLYGSRSRYGEPEGGNERSIGAVTRDDVAAFHAERYRPAATTLIVVGDTTVDRAVTMVEDAMGSWQGGAAAVPRADDRPARAGTSVHLVEKRDAPQSELRIGHVGLSRSHPDYFRVVVMNAILGGLFSSRINLNLREAHAYTYGAFSQFDWRRGAGPFVVSTAVRSDATSNAVREVLREIDRMRTSAPTSEELSLATSYLDGVFPIRYETTSAIAGALAGLVVYGLRDTYFDEYRGRIRSITSADVLAAAQAHLHPDRVQVTIVGDPDSVRTDLDALALGPVAVYDSEGRSIT